MNAKTWQTTCGFDLPLMLGIAGGFLLSRVWPGFIVISIGCGLVIAILCTIGAWFGILICLGRLHLGCPFCGARSPFKGGTRRNLYLECLACGPVRVTSRPFRTAIAEKFDPEAF